MTSSISFITIPVKDIKKSSDFYKIVFDWTKDPKSTEEVHFFKHSNATFALCSEPYFKSILGLSKEACLSNNSTLFSVNFQDEDAVHRVFLKAIESGAAVVKTPAITEWKSFAGFFKAPDGVSWEVACKGAL